MPAIVLALAVTAALAAQGIYSASLLKPARDTWPTYHGQMSGNRFSPLSQINTGNVSQLAPKWMFTLQNAPRLQVTPVVVGGVMYVTSANEAWALDAGSGREIWRYQRFNSRRHRRVDLRGA